MSIREFDNKKGKTYEVRFTYKDKYGLKKYYSKRGFKSSKEARRHESYMKEKIKQGHIVHAKTMNEVFEEYKNNNNLQITSLNLYIKLYDKHIRKTLGNIKITAIDYQKVQTFINDLSNSYSKSNITNIAAIIKNTFIFAYNYGYVERIPFKKIVVSGRDKKNTNKIITDDEYHELLNNTENEAYKIAFCIAHYTGLRLGEILALERKDIDFNNNIIFVNKTQYVDNLTREIAVKKPKTETSNTSVPLPHKLKERLIVWLEQTDSDIIVNDEGTYIAPDKIQNYLTTYSRKHHTHITMYMFRHTYSTTLYKKGIDPKTAQTLLRHKNFNTTMSVYTHLAEDELNTIVDTVFN